MGRDDLRHDPRFATEADRLAHREELYGAVRDWVRTHTDLAPLERTLADAGFAMGVVRTVREVADSDWAVERARSPRVGSSGRHRPHPELAVAILRGLRAGPWRPAYRRRAQPRRCSPSCSDSTTPSSTAWRRAASSRAASPADLAVRSAGQADARRAESDAASVP